LGYLNDTCVFKHHINEASKIINVATHCIKQNKRMIVSNEIVNELYPGKNLEESVRERAIELHKCIEFAIDSKIIDIINITQNCEMSNNYKKIRNEFYGWMNRTDYLQKLMKDGKITKEEIQSKGFKFKDVGECTLVAIAMTNPHKYVIVTEDKGLVYKHPDQNIFDTYAPCHEIEIWKYAEWKDNTGYID
jgi:hypothetical protein